MIAALGALRSLQSKKKLAVEKRQETYFLSSAGTEKWIEDYVESETVVARKQVHDAETTMKQKVKYMTTAESAGGITRKFEITFEEMFNAIGDSLISLATSNNREDWDDENDV
jgi:hypothetical protein